MSEMSEVEILQAQVETLATRVLELERERAEEVAAAHATIAELQERVYWLDRWHLDLNALMAKPGAAEFRALVRLARKPVRWVRIAKRKLLG